MRKVSFHIFIICMLAGTSASISFGQTKIRGKILSMDGRTIPKVVISITPEHQGDIFSEHYEDVLPDEDGTYQLQLQEPGLYTISIRGVYHGTQSIPVLVYDQPSMDMDVFLLPAVFNNGRYFGESRYLEWIRVVGNFNDYSFDSGRMFSMNNDGSISAFIPVTSDTVRYQVRGLIGHGPAPLPTADEYAVRDDNSFESVLYKNLPQDSLEIRYAPGETIPYQRDIPAGVNLLQFVQNRYIVFKNKSDRYWIEPLIWMRFFSMFYQMDHEEMTEEIYSAFQQSHLHPQQMSLLSIAYAGILHGVDQGPMPWHPDYDTRETDELTFDSQIVLSIPEIVSPVHPAWSRNNNLLPFLMELVGHHPPFEEYFEHIVEYHPDPLVVRSAALALIRFFAHEYTSVEEMNVYRLIVERYGESNLARHAHRHFEQTKIESGG